MWACRVFLSGTSRSPAERASTNVTVLGWLFIQFLFIFFMSSSGMRFFPESAHFCFPPKYFLVAFYFNFIPFFFAALPQISLRPRDDPITVIAGESAQIDCMVADARPAPAINWVLGTKRFFFSTLLLFHPLSPRIHGIIICINDTHFP